MPNLLSLSKHEEFESNSALQIRNQKERRAKEARKMKQEIFAGCKIFAGCEIAFPIPLFILLLTFLLFFCHFLFVSPIYPHCNSICFGFLVFCTGYCL